jgi:hypothetical protein
MRSLLPKDQVEWIMVVGAVLVFGGAILALWLFGVA